MSSVPHVPQSPPAVIPDHRRHFADNLRQTALLFVLLAIPAVIFTVWATPAATDAIGRARAEAMYQAAHPSGAAPTAADSREQGTDRLECPLCDGSGQVDRPWWSDIGGGHWNHTAYPCPRCRGRGWLFRMEMTELAPRIHYAR